MAFRRELYNDSACIHNGSPESLQTQACGDIPSVFVLELILRVVDILKSFLHLSNNCLRVHKIPGNGRPLRKLTISISRDSLLPLLMHRGSRFLSTQIVKMASRRSTRLSVASYSGGQSKTTNEDSYGSSAPKKSVKRKGVPDEKTNDGSEQSVAVPSTPKRKKTVKYVPPYTPTPAAASIMAAPHDHATLLQVDRLADPHKTNAPLVSPMTSKVVASTSVAAASPLKAVSSHARTTTRDILEKAVAHLITIDPRLKPIIEKHHCRVFSPEGLADEIDPFEALSSGIISQQVGINHILRSITQY